MKHAIIKFAIKNQKFFNLLVVFIIISGIFVYINARKELFPEFKDAFIKVEILYPGASAQQVQQKIISHLESKVGVLSEIKKSESVSQKNIGISIFTVDRLYFHKLNDIQQKVQDVVNKIDFPIEIEKPIINSYTMNDIPIISIHLSGMLDNQLYEVSQKFETSLRQIPELAEVQILGRQDYQYTINVNPQKIAERGISIGEINHAIQQTISDIPSGDITKDNITHSIQVISPVNNIQDIGNIIIRANEDSQTIKIKDIAKVQYDLEKPHSIYSINGKNGIVFDISKSEFADIIVVSKKIQNLVNIYQKKNPSIDFKIFKDKSKQVKSRLKLLNDNLTIGLILVFIILALFFNISTAIWTTAGVPIAFCIGIIGAIIFAGQTINILSMIGFLVVLGILVDDGIVFSENSYRYLEMGYSPYDSVVKGMGEVLPSVVFAVITTISTSLCMLLIGEKLGDFSRPLPIIIALTLVGSLFETIFVLPGHLVHSFSHHSKDFKVSWRTRFFAFFQKIYEKILSFLLRFRKTSIIILVGSILGITLVLLQRIPFVFFAGAPSTVDIFFETKVGTPLEDTEKITKILSDYLSQNKAFDNVFSISGIGRESHKVHITGEITPNTDARYNWMKYKTETKQFISTLDGIKNLRYHVKGEDSFEYDLIEVVVKGTNYQAVKDMAKEIQEFSKTLPNIESPRLNISPQGYFQYIKVDAKKALTLGITPRQISQNIGLAYEGLVVHTITTNGRNIDIELQFDDKYTTYDTLQKIKIPNKYARFVNLSDIATIEEVKSDIDIYTSDGLYAVKILDTLYQTSILSNNSFNIISEIENKFNHYQDDLNAAPYFQSTKQETETSLHQLVVAISIGITLVFLILVLLFNSFISTMVAIAGTPFILFGLVIGLFIMDLPFSNMALIGAVSLLGIVVNDSIVMLEFFHTNISREEDFIPAIIKNAGLRLRAIMITTITTVLGIAPLVFGFAGNHFLLQPLATTIFFGVLTVSIITLILLPLFVTILEIDCKGLFLGRDKSKDHISIWSKIKKIISIKIIPLLLVICFPISHYSQEEVLQTTNLNIIGESDFLDLYLENSFNTKIIDINQKVAKQQVKKAFAPYSGSFFMNGQFIQGITTNTTPIHNITITGKPISQDLAIDFTNYDATIGVDGTIYPLGTYLKMQGGIRGMNHKSVASDFNPLAMKLNSQDIREKYSTPFFNITLIQPFLKNGFAYNMHKKIISIAKNQGKLDILTEKVKLEGTVLKALIQYHKLILDTKILAIRKYSLDEIDTLYDTQKKLAETGARSQFDIQQIEIQIKKSEAVLSQMTSAIEEEFLELEDRLGIILDRENLNFLDHSLALEKDFDMTNIYQKALDSTSDITKIRLLANNANNALAIAKNQLLPELNLVLSYENSKSKYMDSPILNKNGKDFLVPQNNLFVGVQFKMPLEWRPQLAMAKEAQYRVDSVNLNKQNYEIELKYIIRENFYKWRENNKQIEYQKDIISLSEEISRAAKIYYRNSEISVDRYFKYIQDYRIAQMTLVLQEFNQKVSSLTLLMTEGTLLEEYNIDLITF